MICAEGKTLVFGKLFKHLFVWIGEWRFMMESKTNIIIAILALGLVLTSAILAFNIKATTVIKEPSEQEERNTVSLSANSKLTVAPDEAEVYFRIQTEGKTAIDAQDGNRRASDNVIGALKAKGVEEGDIETAQYYVQRKYRYDPKTGESEVVGYELIHVLKVTMKNVEDVGSLVDTGVSAGANGVDSIQFTLSDEKEKEVRDRALSEAGRLARDKAETLASSVGVSLGELVSVSEESFSFVPYRFAERGLAFAALEAKAEPSEIQPQSLEVSATVNVVYEIE